jgi:hypothetical protein
LYIHYKPTKVPVKLCTYITNQLRYYVVHKISSQYVFVEEGKEATKAEEEKSIILRPTRNLRELIITAIFLSGKKRKPPPKTKSF